MVTATARAHPNIALVKYWGKRDVHLNLPAVPSISLTLDTFETVTSVRWGASRDAVYIDKALAGSAFAERALAFLDRVHPNRPPCEIHTHNNFPTKAGLASSSSGFAALALAACRAAGQEIDKRGASVLARKGSGSACRSLWGGFVEWTCGTQADGTDSHGEPIAPEDHWKVAMVVAIVSDQKKPVGSTEGMIRTQQTSPFYGQWVQTAAEDCLRAREAIHAKDLTRLGQVMEASTFKMHATMHTASPPLLYWKPNTVACLAAVSELRSNGIEAWSTMDAGPNVKVLCQEVDAQRVRAALEPHAMQTHILRPGPGAEVWLS